MSGAGEEGLAAISSRSGVPLPRVIPSRNPVRSVRARRSGSGPLVTVDPGNISWPAVPVRAGTPVSDGAESPQAVPPTAETFLHTLGTFLKGIHTLSDLRDITTTPSKDVHNVLSTPRQAKRLKIQNTADILDRF